MANNIFDYMFWRGDLSFSEREFNDVDGVILARLSYLPFELIMNQNSIKEITIAEMAKKLIAYPNIENMVIQKEDIQFLNELLNSKRFNSMKLFAYINKDLIFTILLLQTIGPNLFTKNFFTVIFLILQH